MDNIKTIKLHMIEIILLVLVWVLILVNFSLVMKNRNEVSIKDNFATQLEEVNNELENTKMPVDKLSSYKEKRAYYIEEIDKANQVIINSKQNISEFEDLKSTLEKMIRCQKAVITLDEKLNCEDEAVYNKYPL